jgi:hypothetical protein
VFVEHLYYCHIIIIITPSHSSPSPNFYYHQVCLSSRL